MESKLKTISQTLDKREQEAKSAEQRKNDVVMYLAHDLKTPLTSIVGYLSLLDEAPEMPIGQRAKYVNITLEKAYRLEQLIDEFFDITRYNLQGVALSKENIGLHYMLEQMADEFYPLLSAKGQRITLRAPEDLAIYGDPDKLARVFNNILKNATAYSPEGSQIEITAITGGDNVSIEFRNEGGVPEDKLSYIFDKFYRLDTARATGSGGAGFGLAIAKEIVLLHGGAITAESKNGSMKFTVTLPVDK
jgi:two-component system sensor histidine kinase VanS